jgi:hypothetical protein
MRKELHLFLSVLILLVASLCGCTGDDDGNGNGNGNGGEGESESESEGEGEGFKLYEDSFDWADANENAKPITGLDAIKLANDNVGTLAPGGTMILFSTTEYEGNEADKTSGKAVAWQFHFHKTEGSDVMNRIMNVAEKGGAVVKDWYQSSDMTPWDSASATIDTDELPSKLEAHQPTIDFLTANPTATLTIQSSSGPFGGPEETSWLMWYSTETDSHQVHISAIDGEIVV